MLWGIFGNITDPFAILAPGTSYTTAGTQGQGLIILLNNLVKFVIVVAGLFAFWNFIAAGYGFMSAGGEAKAIQKAWEKIWLSLVGLLIIAGSFVLAAIFGWIIFKDASAIINPTIYGP